MFLSVEGRNGVEKRRTRRMENDKERTKTFGRGGVMFKREGLVEWKMVRKGQKRLAGEE